MTTNQIAKLRVKFIEAKRGVLNSKVSEIQKKLFSAVFDKLISNLELSEGRIISNGKNIDLVSALDKIIKDFQSNEYLKTINLFANDLKGLQALNETYFRTLEEDKDKLKKISSEVNKKMQSRIGINPDRDWETNL